MSDYFHLPVMIEEAISSLNIKKGGMYFDGTLGGASYTERIVKELGDSGQVVATDLDPLAIENFKKKNLSNVVVFNNNYSDLLDIISDQSNKKVFLKNKFDGLVLDLGLSSAQLSDEQRGFSFGGAESLEMAFGPDSPLSTYQIINTYRASDLERIIKEYGEESWAKKISLAIVEYRRKKKIQTSAELAELISQVIPRKFWSRKIHPATKTFQALRIETNGELASLKKFLSFSLEILNPGGRIVIVSFHSLEDRIVKNFFRDKSREDNSSVKIITRKPLVPGEEEIEKNYRSRSAKLRVLEKIK